MHSPYEIAPRSGTLSQKVRASRSWDVYTRLSMVSDAGRLSAGSQRMIVSEKQAQTSLCFVPKPAREKFRFTIKPAERADETNAPTIRSRKAVSGIEAIRCLKPRMSNIPNAPDAGWSLESVSMFLGRFSSAQRLAGNQRAQRVRFTGVLGPGTGSWLQLVRRYAILQYHTCNALQFVNAISYEEQRSMRNVVEGL